MLYLFLVLLFYVGPCEATIPKILFTLQSNGISLPTWFDQFTLCLAPLVAHVAGGVVSPTLLPNNTPPPGLSARIPYFNPISIIWRYYIIADRRLRARSWDRADLAACNAVFWEGERERWDGSEEIMVKSRAWITKIPDTAHVAPLSASSITSLVLTAQGINATFLIIGSLTSSQGHYIPLKLATVFTPLGCLGLIRLPAAFWLSSDYGFMNYDIRQSAPLLPASSLEKVVSDNLVQLRASQVDMAVQDRLFPPHCWKGVLYRVFWLLTVWVILGASAMDCTHIWWKYPPHLPYLSTSGLLFLSIYLVLTVASIAIHTFYVVTGKATSTIIPCIHATWYKIFTLVFFVAIFVCVIIAALETRIQSNGVFTSYPEFYCPDSGGICTPVGRGQGNNNV